MCVCVCVCVMLVCCVLSFQLKEDLTPFWEVYLPTSKDQSEMNQKDHLENIRGFLLKKRKWPLKGFHKVLVFLCSCMSRAINLIKPEEDFSIV